MLGNKTSNRGRNPLVWLAPKETTADPVSNSNVNILHSTTPTRRRRPTVRGQTRRQIHVNSTHAIVFVFRFRWAVLIILPSVSNLHCFEIPNGHSYAVQSDNVTPVILLWKHCTALYFMVENLGHGHGASMSNFDKRRHRHLVPLLPRFFGDRCSAWRLWQNASISPKFVVVMKKKCMFRVKIACFLS